MSAHTPGPWTLKLDLAAGGAGGVIWGNASGVVAFTTSTRLDSGRLYVNEADARLIAAAPELLAACEVIEAALREAKHPDDATWWTLSITRKDADALRAAIKKARGQ